MNNSNAFQEVFTATSATEKVERGGGGDPRVTLKLRNRPGEPLSSEVFYTLSGSFCFLFASPFAIIGRVWAEKPTLLALGTLGNVHHSSGVLSGNHFLPECLVMV